MGLGKKIFNKLNKLFGREAFPTERPLENDVSPEVLMARGQPPSSPDSSGDGDRRGNRRTRDVSSDNRLEPTAIHPGAEGIIGNTKNTAVDNISGALDLEPQQDKDGRYPNDQREINSPERVCEIRNIDPSSSGNRNRSAAAVNDNTDLLFPSGRPSLSHTPNRSTEFYGATNSGISFGQGSVNVSNVNTGNTTTVTGTLIQNNSPSERIRPGLELLQKRVATSAFHNSAQRSDPPRCHPNTRVSIQKQIYDWILMDVLVRQAWIMWIHGAAGAGKSAIMQSVAELCEKTQIPLASFFFIRTDGTRNSMVSFIATLVYQLIQNVPQARDDIFATIESNPLVFDQSLESQLQKLIIQPLLRVQQHIKGFFIVFIDGLDECIERAHQSELIKLLGAVCGSKVPVIFLLASRREPQIEAEFVRKPVHEILQILPLDNSDVEQTSEDIRRFVMDKFSDIKETHLLKNYIPVDWPPSSVIEEIVDKSSGQFIFASVVVKYISSPRANPVRQLEVVRDIRLRDSSSQNPFAHLDALYQHIFSQVETLDKVFDIIAFRLLLPFYDISHINILFRLEPGELDVLFADLTAVILCEPHAKLKFLHASLPDFLLDETRSGQYHINLDNYRTKLLCTLLELPPISDSISSANNWKLLALQEPERLHAIGILLEKTKASERLRSAFMQFNYTFYFNPSIDRNFLDGRANILQHMTQLDFGDQGKAYQHVADVFAAGFST